MTNKSKFSKYSMVEGNVSFSPDPSFSPSESDSRSRGTSVDEGTVVGKTKERARSDGVIPVEEALVSPNFLFVCVLFRFVFCPLSERRRELSVAADGGSRWKFNIAWFRIL